MELIGKIKEIVVHCTADVATSTKGVDEIREYHVVDKNWDDIGYHFLIDTKGVLHEGRSLKYRGAHVQGKNKGKIGIAYVGGIDDNGAPKNTLNGAQEYTLRNFLDTYAVNGITVVGHNKYNKNKACPSFNVQKWYYGEPQTTIKSSKRLKGVGVASLGLIPVATNTIKQVQELSDTVKSINVMNYVNLLGLVVVIGALGFIIYTKVLDNKRE